MSKKCFRPRIANSCLGFMEIRSNVIVGAGSMVVKMCLIIVLSQELRQNRYIDAPFTVF